jgi:trehalose 6-phosphate phosphatase
MKNKQSGRSLFSNLHQIDRELGDARVTGLLTDVDGTLSEIRDRPEEARVDPEIADILGRLRDFYRLVGVISGRRAEDVANMVGRSDILFIGNHGLERLINGRLSMENEAGGEIAAAKVDLLKGLPSAAGLALEDKLSVLAIHYRLCRDEQAIEAAKRLAVRVAGEHGLRTQSGRQVIEIRPRGADKGITILNLAQEYKLERVVYLGDDRTDLDAFRVLRETRANAGLKSVTIGVVTAESPPELPAEADYCVNSVSEVRKFLDWLVFRSSRD